MILKLIKKYVLFFILFIVLFICIGLFLQTKLGFGILEKASIMKISIVSGVSLEKPANWLMTMSNGGVKGYELSTIKFGKTTKIGLYSINFKDLPNFEGSLSLENKSIGASLVSKDNKITVNIVESNKMVPSSYAKYIKEYKFDSFRTLSIGSRIWAEYTTKRKDSLWKRLYTIHNDDIIICNHRYKADEVYEDYLDSVLKNIIFE